MTCAQIGSYNDSNTPWRIGPSPTNNQSSIFGGLGSFVIIGPGYHPKQEPTTVDIELCSPPPDVI